MLLAILCNSAGLGCLYGAWRGFTRFKHWAVYAGWILLFLSVWAFIKASNVEFGIPYALLTTGIVSWLIVFINYEIRRQKTRDIVAGELVMPRASTVSIHLLKFIMAVPIAGVSAALSTTMLSGFLPWQQGNEFVLALLLTPFVWGGFSYWVCAAPKLLWPSLVLTNILLASLLVLYS